MLDVSQKMLSKSNTQKDTKAVAMPKRLPMAKAPAKTPANLPMDWNSASTLKESEDSWPYTSTDLQHNNKGESTPQLAIDLLN